MKLCQGTTDIPRVILGLGLVDVRFMIGLFLALVNIGLLR